MHKYASTTYMSNNPLPSPEYTGDSDSDLDILYELEQRRRQLDTEVARFRAQKEKDFRDFEHALRARKISKPYDQSSLTDLEASFPHPLQPMPSSSSDLTWSSRCTTSKRGGTNKRSLPQPLRLTRTSSSSKATGPTLCLEKLNISGENVPVHSVHTPPTPPLPTLSVSRADNHGSNVTWPRSPPSLSPPATRRARHEEDFTGLFIPSYLPWIENGEDASLQASQSDPSVPLSESKQPNQRPLMVSPENRSISSPDLAVPPSSPQVSVNPRLHASTPKRAYTEPAVPASVLPSALRTSRNHGKHGRKRKRVTFRLADRAIVEPSSSYEEGPSPSLESDGGTSSNVSSISSELAKSPDDGQTRSFSDELGRSKRRDSPPAIEEAEAEREEIEEQVGMSMGDLLIGSGLGSKRREGSGRSTKSTVDQSNDGYFRARPKHGRSGVAQPASSHPRYPVRPDRHSQSSDLSLAHVSSSRDGGGATGFFELDEELDYLEDAPPPKEPGDFDLDAEDKDEIDPRRGEEDNTSGLEDEFAAKAFAASSIPIDIVRPTVPSVTNSWVGTFGH